MMMGEVLISGKSCKTSKYTVENYALFHIFSKSAVQIGIVTSPILAPSLTFDTPTLKP